MNFKKLWDKTDTGAKALSDCHGYTVGDQHSTPTFPRLEAYDAAEPSAHGPEWREWNRVRSKYLLGGARVGRTGRGYTVFPEDEAVNAAILGTANKLVQARIDDETGLPCERFRDLCSHLALCVETTAEGNYSTFYLAKHASAYLRKMAATQSITDNQTRNKGQGHD